MSRFADDLRAFFGTLFPTRFPFRRRARAALFSARGYGAADAGERLLTRRLRRSPPGAPSAEPLEDVYKRQVVVVTLPANASKRVDSL